MVAELNGTFHLSLNENILTFIIFYIILYYITGFCLSKTINNSCLTFWQIGFIENINSAIIEQILLHSCVCNSMSTIELFLFNVM